MKGNQLQWVAESRKGIRPETNQGKADSILLHAFDSLDHGQWRGAKACAEAPVCCVRVVI
jgi:hypothetical protein